MQAEISWDTAVLLGAAIAATVSWLHFFKLAVQPAQAPFAAFLMPLTWTQTPGLLQNAPLGGQRQMMQPLSFRTQLLVTLVFLLAIGGGFAFLLLSKRRQRA